jgi:uncharacterized membrane protein
MKRESYLDWLRGVAIVLMVINHVASYLVIKPSPIFSHIFAYLGVSLAGPLFLFISGYVSALGFNRSDLPKSKVIKKVLSRFIILVGCWLAVNLLFYFDEPWYRGRILLLFAFCSLFAWPLTVLARKVSGRIIILSASLLALTTFAWVAPWFGQISLTWPVVGVIFFSEFPLWPWLGVFAGGVLANSVLERPNANKQKIESWFLGVGIVMLSSWFVLSLISGRYFLWIYQYDISLNNYWTPSIITWLWTLGWLLIAIPLAKAVSERFAPILAEVGRKAIWFYFVQFWLILTIGRGILGIKAQTIFEFFILNLIIILIICYLVRSKTFARITALNPASLKGRIF